MVKDNRIQEILISGTFASTTTDTIYSDQAINGEILQIDWNFNRAGSVWLTISGTGEEIWRRNAPSGASTQVTQPRVFTESTTGSIANAEHVPFIVNDKIVLNTGSALSGTTPFTMHVRYR